MRNTSEMNTYLKSKDDFPQKMQRFLSVSIHNVPGINDVSYK